MAVDIAYASTEPFAEYNEFHENLNKTLKILTASVSHLNSHLATCGDDKALGNLIVAADSSWKFPPLWTIEDHPPKEMYGLIASLGLVAAFSALDEFITGVEAETARWNNNSKNNNKRLLKESTSDSDNRLENFIEKYNWSVDNVRRQLALLKFFRMCRNCIAHRNYKASPALSAYSHSEALSEALDKCEPEVAAKGLPSFYAGERIALHPKTVIFGSHLIREVAKTIDGELIQWLGFDGLVNMAANRALNENIYCGPEPYRGPEALVNRLLQHRYRINVDDHSVIKALRRIDLWDECKRIYKDRATQSLIAI